MTQTSRLVIEIDSRNAERNARAVAAELENLTAKGARADVQMTEMSASIKSLVGYMGGILTINKAIAMADGYTQMAARIRNATASAEEYRLVQDRVLATANTTYRSLGEAQEVYLSLAGGMKSLGRSTTETLDLVDSLSFSFTHNATRTDQAQSAMDSLSKSMAKGKIDADAWISIVTGADNVIADMAKTTGKSEAEIRKLGAEGKASLEDLIKTLIATREQNEKLANNMENSLADGFTMLSNAVTVYLGKANEATSATGIMAGALGELAQNLDSVANVAMIGGVAFLTKTILAQTVAIRGSIAESVKKNAANISELTTNAALTASEARKTSAVAQYTAMQLADAKATAARMTGLQRLSYIQATVIPLETKATQATAAHAAATAADTIAQEANNKARSRAAALYGLIGGPIGAVTLGVTALAAGYVYFSSHAEEANKKLEEQAIKADDAALKLKELSGVQKQGAIDDLTKSLESQNKVLRQNELAIGSALIAIQNKYNYDEKIVDISNRARLGTLSYAQAIEELNKTKITPELFNRLKEQYEQYDKNRARGQVYVEALKSVGIETKLVGNEAENTAAKVRVKANAMDADAASTRNAANANAQYTATLQQRLWDQQFLNRLIVKHNMSQEKANMLLEAYHENTKSGKKGVSAEQGQLIAQIDSEKQALERLNEQKRASQKASNKASKQLSKDKKESDRLKDEQVRNREQISYDYADRLKQTDLNLTAEITRIREANFEPSITKNYVETARNRAELSKKIFIAEQEFEINAFQYTEEEKLSKQKQINELRLQANTELDDELFEAHAESLNQRFQHELGLIQLAKESRMFQMREQFLDETVAMEQRYDLEQRKLVEITDLQERAYQAEMLRLQKMTETQQRLKDAAKNWANTQAEMQGTSGFLQIRDDRDYREKQSSELADAQYASLAQSAADPNADLEAIAAARELIWQEHHDRMTLIEKDYSEQKSRLEAESALNSLSELGGALTEMLSKSSTSYALALGMQKSFSIYSSLMAAKTAYAQAFADPSAMTVGQKVLGAMAVAAPIASALGELMSIRTEITGFATGGYIRGPGSGTSDSIPIMASNGEFMIRAAAVQKLGKENLDFINKHGALPQDTRRVGMGTVDAVRQGSMSTTKVTVQPQININVPPGYTAEQSQGSDGSVTIDIVEKAVRNSWSQLGNPNSWESKQLKNYTTAGVKR
jgi:tape measure domain-containing protein